MTQKIYKYVLNGAGDQFLSIPGFQKILSVKKQYERAVLYVVVDTEVSTETDLWVKNVWTGQELFGMDGYEYLDSLSFCDDDYVVHFFVKVI